MKFDWLSRIKRTLKLTSRSTWFTKLGGLWDLFGKPLDWMCKMFLRGWLGSKEYLPPMKRLSSNGLKFSSIVGFRISDFHSSSTFCKNKQYLKYPCPFRSFVWKESQNVYFILFQAILWIIILTLFLLYKFLNKIKYQRKCLNYILIQSKPWGEMSFA